MAQQQEGEGAIPEYMQTASFDFDMNQKLNLAGTVCAAWYGSQCLMRGFDFQAAAWIFWVSLGIYRQCKHRSSDVLADPSKCQKTMEFYWKAIGVCMVISVILNGIQHMAKESWDCDTLDHKYYGGDCNDKRQTARDNTLWFFVFTVLVPYSCMRSGQTAASSILEALNHEDHAKNFAAAEDDHPASATASTGAAGVAPQDEKGQSVKE